MTNRSRRCQAAAVIGLAVAMVTTACTSAHGRAVANKAGGDTVVLRVGTIDHVNSSGTSYGPEAFVNSLQSVSNGKIKVEVTEDYGNGDAGAESKLVAAIASGSLDGGWPSTRAFASAGISGLQVVEAPMTITNYATEAALVSGPIAGALLDQLKGSGVLGLGLAVGPLRRPFASRAPLLALTDWKGISFRAYNSPIQTDTVRALGGTPVAAGLAWVDDVRAGSLRGAEFDVAQYLSNGYAAEAGMVTANVVLWPKVFVLSISQKRFASLTSQQQGWVRQAAAQAVQASARAKYDESPAARELCGRGARFVEASADQVAALKAAVAPVVEKLAADKTAGPLLAKLQALAAQHPGSDTPDVPTTCRQPTALAAGDPGAIPATTSTLPAGRYRVAITASEIQQAGISNGPGFTGTWTLKVGDGTYELTCSPIDDPGHDCGNSSSTGVLEAGDLKGSGDRVYFVSNADLLAKLSGCLLPASTSADHCAPVDPYWLTWKLEGDTLLVSKPGGVGSFDKLLKPFQKIS